MRRLFGIVAIWMLCIGLGAAQGSLSAEVLSPLNMRQGPSVDNAVLAQLAPGTALEVLGRNAVGDWALVRTTDGANVGWVAMGFIRFDRAVRIQDELPLAEGNAAEAAAGVPAPAQPNLAPEVLPEEINNFPPVIVDMNRARQIFNVGLAQGRNPASFMKVGESNIAGTVFLCNFQWGNYFLGEFEYFETVITHFNQTESFCRFNVSAREGFSTFTLFDSTFSPPEACEPNETPLDCEMRRSQAMYAFVYIGIGDMPFTTAQEFRGNLTDVLNRMTSNGIIPIVATFPMADEFNRDGKPPAFNTVIREVAAQLRVPLIDMRAATFNYEKRGTGPDGYHLSVPDGAETSFVGNQDAFGRTLYEFYALQVLYDLHTTLNS